MEAVTDLDACIPFVKKSDDDAASTVAVDARYTNLDSTSPNEYEIQSLSGVFDTLEALPSFNELVPEA